VRVSHARSSSTSILGIFRVSRVAQDIAIGKPLQENIRRPCSRLCLLGKLSTLVCSDGNSSSTTATLKCLTLEYRIQVSASNTITFMGDVSLIVLLYEYMCNGSTSIKPLFTFNSVHHQGEAIRLQDQVTI